MPNPRGRRRGHPSIRVRIFAVMLAVSVIPTTVITVAASLNTYTVLYRQLVTVNSQGMVWARDRLDQFVDELKSTFYAFETDAPFRRAVAAWNAPPGFDRDQEAIREDLVSLVNRSSLVNATGITLYSDGTVMRAERVGVRILAGESGGDVADRGGFAPRGTGLQRNVYLEARADGVYAMHGMNRFEDRSPIATLFVRIRPAILEGILEPLRFYADERVLLVNDAGAVIMETGAPEGSASLSAGIGELAPILAGDAPYDGYGNCIVFHGKAAEGKLLLAKVVSRGEIAQKVLATVYAGVFVGLACIVAAVFLSAFLSILVSGPILKLAEKVKNIDMGRLEIEAGAFEGDEIGLLEDHLVRFVDRIRELIIEEYVMKVEAKNAQLQALQAQINPHFLHNTLQMIGGMALVKNAPEIYNMASALSDGMRYAMDFEGQQVPLGREIENLKNYFLIQKERFRDRFSVTFDIDPSLESVFVPKLVLQPIAENSFKHGFREAIGRWTMRVSANLGADGRARILVEDNGVGIPPERAEAINAALRAGDPAPLSRSGHIGLENVNARLRLAYSAGDGLFVRGNEAGGTTVELAFTPIAAGGAEGGKDASSSGAD